MVHENGEECEPDYLAVLRLHEPTL